MATSLSTSPEHRTRLYWPAHHTRCLAILEAMFPYAEYVTTYHAITPLLNTHHRLPQTPKLVRATTGNVTWKIAPGLALATINGATSPYPSQTHIQACHQERPSWIIDEAIIHLCKVALFSSGRRAQAQRCGYVRRTY